MTREEAENYIPPRYGRIRGVIMPDDGGPPVYVPWPYKHKPAKPAYGGSLKDKFEKELIRIARQRGGGVTDTGRK